MQVAALKVNFVARPGMARQAALKPRQTILVHSAPDKAQIDASIKEAEEACAGGDAGECAAAWDTVEELSAAASHAKDAAKANSDPLELYCDDNPDADECRVYDD